MFHFHRWVYVGNGYVDAENALRWPLYPVVDICIRCHVYRTRWVL